MAYFLGLDDILRDPIRREALEVFIDASRVLFGISNTQPKIENNPAQLKFDFSRYTNTQNDHGHAKTDTLATPATVVTHPRPILTSLQDQINDLEASLVNLITKNYHAARQKSYKIGNKLFSDELSYNLSEAAQAIGIEESSLKIMHTPSQGSLIYRESTREYSGYEVVRYHLRRRIANNMNVIGVAQFFGIDEATVNRLLEIKILQRFTSNTITQRSIVNLFDLVFPKKNTPRFYEISKYLGGGETPTAQPIDTNYVANKDGGVVTHPVQRPIEIVVDTPIHPIIKPAARLPSTGRLEVRPYDRNRQEATSPSIKYFMRYEGMFLTREGKTFDGMKIPRDYTYTEDKEQHPDAKYVRFRKGGYRDSIEEISLRDYFRLLLARASMTEEAFRQKVGSSKYEEAVKKLGLALMAPQLYDGKPRFLPGSDRIATLDDSVIIQVAEKARPVMVIKGPFLKENEMREASLRFRPEGLETHAKNGTIVSLDLYGAKRYNAFQAFHAFS